MSWHHRPRPAVRPRRRSRPREPDRRGARPTPFYGESGGQVGDTRRARRRGVPLRGHRHAEGRRTVAAPAATCAKANCGPAQKVTARVETPRRQGIRRAHSATHILHYALQKTPRQARPAARLESRRRLAAVRLHQPGRRAGRAAGGDRRRRQRARSRRPSRSAARTVPLAEARKAGAMMLFGEKYPDLVRMVCDGRLQQGTVRRHALDQHAGGRPLEIISEESVSAGTRRIMALTGDKAQQHVSQTRAALQAAAERLGVGVLEVPEAARDLMQTVRDLKKQLTAGAKAVRGGRQGEAGSGSGGRTGVRANQSRLARRGADAERLAVRCAGSRGRAAGRSGRRAKATVPIDEVRRRVGRGLAGESRDDRHDQGRGRRDPRRQSRICCGN